jgi:hypothetical protein
MDYWSDNYDADTLIRGAHERQLLEEGYGPEQAASFACSPLHLHGELSNPIFDEEHVAAGGNRPTWPNDSEFAVCLTHDVDHVHATSFRYKFLRQQSRTLRRQLRRSGQRETLRRTAQLYKLVTFGSGFVPRAIGHLAENRGPDPYHRFERWLEIESAVGAQSTFFFAPSDVLRPHRTDRYYQYDDPIVFDGERSTVGEMLADIDRRGWEVGLHPMVNAHDDVGEMRYQRGQLDDVIDSTVRSVRHHRLHTDVRKTPRVHSDAGFEFDSSLGVKGNGSLGFRFGTCYPWWLYDWTGDCNLPVLEVPPVLMDSFLDRQIGPGANTDVAFRYIERYAEVVKPVGGVFTLNFHGSRFDDEWLAFYKRVLRYLDDRGAYFGTVEEIGDWWREYNADVSHLGPSEDA